MKNIKIYLILLAVGIASAVHAQTKQGVEITAHINGLKDGDIVKIGNRFKDLHYVTWMDSCKVVNGNFHFKIDNIPKGPRDYEVWRLIQPKKPGEAETSWDFHLYLNNGEKVAVTGDYVFQEHSHQDITKEITVKGSPSNDAFNWVKSNLRYADSVHSLIYHRFVKIKDSIGYDKGLVKKQIERKQMLDHYLDSLTKNVNTIDQIGIPLLIHTLNDWWGGYHGYFITRRYTSLSPAIQNSFEGRAIRNVVKIAVGQPFPGFVLPDLDGNKIALKDIMAKSKVTLVHFWGTTSFDRETYQNELKSLYGRYHAKGLDVIAVSADTSKDDWTFMIHQKKYPWVNVIAEPKGWGEGSLINDVYDEGGHSIPNTTNVLIDDKGIIIAWDVNGVELQYYLDKYLGN